ncbi:MAG: polysaccharide biosynthesis tyrosine autokinase [Acidobacteriota bacterium]|nr:polysaccharide biosynthesis tyrosine autokinase [Acidobacteriota bacterium]
MSEVNSLRASYETPATPGPLPVYPADRQDHLLDRLAVLYKYRHVAFTIFVLTFAVVMLNTYSNIPMYRAHARVLINDERSTSSGLSENLYYYEDPEPYYQTQYQILSGRQLAAKTVQALDLKQVSDLDGSGAQPTGATALVRSLRHQAGELIHPVRTWFSTPAPAEAPATPRTSQSAVVDAFLSRVSVSPVPSSHLVDVYFESADPAFAARAVDTLASQYVQQNLDFRNQSTQKTLAWLTKEIQNQQARVEADERAMAEYREKQDALSLEDRQNIVVARLNQLNDAVTQARTVLLQKETLYKQVQQALTEGGPDTVTQILKDPYIQNLMSQLADLQREKARLSERYGDKHPAIIKVNASIADAKRQLQQATAKAVAAIKNDYESARSDEQKLEASLDDQKKLATDLNRKNIDYSVLQRNAQSDRQVFESLLARQKEMSVTANSGENNVRLLDHAEVPKAPFAPNPQRSAMFGLLFGLVFGVGTAFGLDYLNDTIKTPEDITRRLGLPFLGLVPAVRGRDGRYPLLSDATPHEFSEAFRALRTSIVLPTTGINNGRGGKPTVLVTSAQPLEGKTTTACNLAMALAVGGARVLIIDADLRRPGMHRTLGLENSRGLAQVLAGEAALRDVIRRTSEPNLLALTAGAPPPNPSELLASDRMKRLLGALAQGPFDWILVDAPPVLAVTDAVILAPLVSGVTFVFGAEMTRRRIAERAVETLMVSRPRAVGGVLNRVDFGRNKYYYSRYYGYKHSSYYSEAPAI